MGDVINLRTERKRREKTKAAEAARENRVRHGRTGAEKKRIAAEAERTLIAFAGHRLGEPSAETAAPGETCANRGESGRDRTGSEAD